MESRDFSRSIEALDGLFAFLDEQLPEGLGERTSMCVHLAVEEIFTNMVRHNEPGRDAISVAVGVDDERVSVRLTDYDVEPFDPESRPEVDVSRPMSEREPGGLGLHLVKSIVDKLVYEYRDRVMLVSFQKNLEPADVRDQA